MTNEELAGIINRLVEGVEKGFVEIKERLAEVEDRVSACDRGISGVGNLVTDLDDKVGENTKAIATLASGVMETSATVQTLLDHLTSQVDHEVKKSMDAQRTVAELSLVREARERG